MTNWIYQGRELTEAPEGMYGFIYKITAGGKVYYGKKAFGHNVKTKISKREKAETKTRKVFKTVSKDSGWRNYTGSSDHLNDYIREHGDEGVYREVLGFAPDKMSLTFAELYVMIVENVLFRDDCWNGNILGKFYKNKVQPIVGYFRK